MVATTPHTSKLSKKSSDPMSSKAPPARKKPNNKDAGALASIKKRIKGKEVGHRNFKICSFKLRHLDTRPPLTHDIIRLAGYHEESRAARAGR